MAFRYRRNVRATRTMHFGELAALVLMLGAFGFSQGIPLVVPAGVPLRLYVLHRIPKRLGAPVEAKLLRPVYAFDHEVLPEGAQVLGTVSQLRPVSKWERAQAILRGDFTPLRGAQVEFTSVVSPTGPVAIQTVASGGLNSFVPLHPPKLPNQNPTGTTSRKQQIKDQANAQIDRVRGIPDLVRGKDKKEALADMLWARLPYHPQYIRSRMRFDAELTAPLNFGTETATPQALQLLGSEPEAGSVVHARLLTPLNSASSQQGEKVEAVLDEPLFSAAHQVIFPEGTRVNGVVVLVKKAGWWHHGGRLRFNFQSVELQQSRLALLPTKSEFPTKSETDPDRTLQVRTLGTLSGAEGGQAPVKVDQEGGVRASESKARLLGTLAALAVARAAGDNDAVRVPSGVGGAIAAGSRPNIGGRTLGGGSGFGLLGMAAAQSSRTVGAALGYYGLAWTVFRTIIAHGPEVQFAKNAVVDISFNSRKQAGAKGK